MQKLPAIADDLTIVGPGADLLTIDALGGANGVPFDGDGWGIIDVDDGNSGSQITVQISGLHLTGGDIPHAAPMGSAGGAILNRENLTIHRSSITESRAQFGGGINNTATGNLTMTDSTISGNSTSQNGGGISNAGTLSIFNSTLSGNLGGSSGAIVNFGNPGTPAILSIENSTISGHTGSIWNSNGYSSASITINSSIVTDPIANSATLTGNHNLFGTTGATTGGANDIITATPMLGPLVDNGGPTKTHALLFGSPAIDAGSSSQTYDQRGGPYSRNDGGGVDIGAYERQGLQWVVDTTVDEDDGDSSAGDLSLREAIRIVNNHAGDDTITFDPTVFGTPQTINISSQLPTISEGLTITGPGAKLLSIDAGDGINGIFGDGDGWRIFEINDGNAGSQIDVNISDLMLTGGDWNSPNVTLGGGALLNRENLTLTRAALIDNASNVRAGALDNQTEGTVNLVASTIAGNRAVTRAGGGIRNDGTLSIDNSTISGNTAALGGGGLSNSNSATLTIGHSTFAENAAGGSGQQANFGNATGVVHHTMFVGPVAGFANVTNTFNRINANLPVGPLADNGGPTMTHALLPGNSGINAGDPAIAGGTDQRGFSRVQSGRVDIGAFEVPSQIPAGGLVVSTVDDTVDADFSSGEFSLREAIAIANDLAGNDTITFSTLFDSSQTINITSQLPTIIDDVTITGPGADRLILDAGGGATTNPGDGYRHFHIDDDTGNVLSVEISGVTLAGGDPSTSDNDGDGGAIVNRENLLLFNSTLSSNTAKTGGGIYNTGVAIVEYSTLSGNTASTRGGGIFNSDFGTADVTSSTLSGNSAFFGGGIFNSTLARRM